MKNRLCNKWRQPEVKPFLPTIANKWKTPIKGSATSGPVLQKLHLAALLKSQCVYDQGVRSWGHKLCKGQGKGQKALERLCGLIIYIWGYVLSETSSKVFLVQVWKDLNIHLSIRISWVPSCLLGDWFVTRKEPSWLLVNLKLCLSKAIFLDDLLLKWSLGLEINLHQEP